MGRYKKSFLTLICICLIPYVEAGEKISLNLKGLHSDPVAVALRQTFDAYLRNVPYNKDAKEFHFDKSYLRSFSEKFIVLGIQDGDFGGYFVTILISPQKMQVWRLWIYQTDEREYQIRQIEKIHVTKEEVRQFNVLCTDKYAEYWL